MQSQHLPPINLRYWCGITLASVFGTNMGDFYAHTSGLGIGAGLAVLAVLCAIVFALERMDVGSREWYYWLVIIIIRTGATNIADFSAFRLHVPELLINGGLIAFLVVLALMQGRQSIASAGISDRMPATGISYWIAMLTAGVLGTTLGDVCEHAFGEGVAAIGLSAILVSVLFWRRGSIGSYYWLVIAVARTTGTAVGDWLAENHILHIGLPLSTLLTGLAFGGLLAFWQPGSVNGSARSTASP